MKDETKGKLSYLNNGLQGSKKLSSSQKSLKKPKATKKQLAPKKQKPKLNIEEQLEPTDSLDLSEKNIIFKPNVGPQTRFLAAGEREVLYGGAAGGGKSYAMLADPLRYMAHSQFSGLLLRHTTEELRELIWKSQEIP